MSEVYRRGEGKSEEVRGSKGIELVLPDGARKRWFKGDCGAKATR